MNLIKYINLILIWFLFLSLLSNGCKTDRKEHPKQTNLNISNNEIEWIDSKKGFYTDIRDDKKYKVVKIGTQTWFAENLAFKPNSGNYWIYEKGSDNLSKYGYLYDWDTAKNVCPPGWHCPTKEEWDILINYLGGGKVAGGKLKSVYDWKSPNEGANNSSGFGALPGGNRSVGGAFYHLGEDALFWSSTQAGERMAWKVRLFHNYASIELQDAARISGRSVRCIKDK